jgi:centrosomal protein CEP41
VRQNPKYANVKSKIKDMGKTMKDVEIISD